jgi:hypothetical protein
MVHDIIHRKPRAEHPGIFARSFGADAFIRGSVREKYPRFREIVERLHSRQSGRIGEVRGPLGIFDTAVLRGESTTNRAEKVIDRFLPYAPKTERGVFEDWINARDRVDSLVVSRQDRYHSSPVRDSYEYETVIGDGRDRSGIDVFDGSPHEVLLRFEKRPYGVLRRKNAGATTEAVVFGHHDVIPGIQQGFGIPKSIDILESGGTEGDDREGSVRLGSPAIRSGDSIRKDNRLVSHGWGSMKEYGASQ